MKWPWFVLLTIVCWGAYVPLIHHAQLSIQARTRPMWAFFLVGTAYFLVAVLVPLAMLASRKELSDFPTNGNALGLGIFAGIAGAVGALGVILALMNGAKPIYVAPLVFAGAPIVNTLVSMAWDRKMAVPDVRFLAGIALAAVGAWLMLRYKPA